MKNILELAYELLCEAGSMWINNDNEEAHYLKILSDGIFGRESFMANILGKKKYSPHNDSKFFSDMHYHILVYAKNKGDFIINGLPRTEEMDSEYKNLDNDPRGVWQSGNSSVKTYSKSGNYTVTTPAGGIVEPPNGRVWITSKEGYGRLLSDNRFWFGKDVPRIKRFLSGVQSKIPPSNNLGLYRSSS